MKIQLHLNSGEIRANTGRHRGDRRKKRQRVDIRTETQRKYIVGKRQRGMRYPKIEKGKARERKDQQLGPPQ